MGLAYGQAGLVTLFTLISVHSLVLLTLATVVLELVSAREERAAGLSNCRMAPVVREYRRAIAYDVDYAYKGSKFRTRLAQDPGNRLRVRVSITPQPMAGP